MSNRPSQNALPERSVSNTQTFIETCVLDADHKALKDHLEKNHVEQGDLDRCLLRGLQIVQSNPRELSHVAPTLTTLLQFGAKWNCSTLLHNKRTPYHIISISPGDHHELLELMIKSSQQTIINQQDNYYKHTALLYAVQNANLNCVKCLITNGADVNLGYARYCSSLTTYPIMEAIGNLYFDNDRSAIHVEIFDLLIDNGADVNLSLFKYDASPMTSAVGGGNVYCVKKLIKKGARLDVMDRTKHYVWSEVARLADVELLKCMFDRGLDKDSTDDEGLSLLWWVLDSDSVSDTSNTEAVTYLLNLGVEIPYYKIKSYQKNTFLASIKHKDPCMKAIRHNMLDVVKLLDEYGSGSCKLFMALRCAVIHGSVEVASYLLNTYKYPLNMEYKIQSDPIDSTYTLLTEQCVDGSDRRSHMSKLLLDHGADPAKPMSAATSANAIMTAIVSRNVKVIALYIRSGVDINLKSYDNSYGTVSPFDASVLHAYHNVTEMLFVSGCSCGVFSFYNNHKSKDNLKVQKMMENWKVQENNVAPLKQQCRCAILNHLSPRADMKIGKLPLPGCLIKYLSIPELDNFV